MTIKDWKKIKGKLQWYNESSYQYIIIKKTNEVLVQSETGTGRFLTQYDKKFKTKSAALKFAKSYMRKH